MQHTTDECICSVQAKKDWETESAYLTLLFLLFLRSKTQLHIAGVSTTKEAVEQMHSIRMQVDGVRFIEHNHWGKVIPFPYFKQVWDWCGHHNGARTDARNFYTILCITVEEQEER